MSDKNARCEDRIGDALAARLDDLKNLYLYEYDGWRVDYEAKEIRGDAVSVEFDPDDYPSEDYDDADERGAAILEGERDAMDEATHEERCNYGLCFDYCAPNGGDEDEDERQGYFRYQLSWGGPSDEFRFFVNPDLSCYRVEYWFLDWFQGASRTLHGEEKALLLQVYEDFREMGVCESELEKAEE